MPKRSPESDEARACARRLLDAAGDLRLPTVPGARLIATLEDIAQRLIDMAERSDKAANGDT